MAQRTGAERFLAPATSTSARFALALVGAALLLGGCGGDSPEPESKSASSASSAPAAAAPKQRASAANQDKSAGKEGAGAAGQGNPQEQPSSQAPGPAAPAGRGQKHGQPVAQPTGPQEQAPAPAERAQATLADITLQSPAIVAANGAPGHLAATYTCDGKGSWPKLSWQGVPPQSAELVLFAMNLQPLEGKIFFDWALAGIDPSLDGIEAAELPKGAVSGTNSFGKRGYEICPQGAGEAYMFALYALPRSLSPKAGFDPAQLRNEILALAGNVGLLPAIYARG